MKPRCSEKRRGKLGAMGDFSSRLEEPGRNDLAEIGRRRGCKKLVLP